jgi:hypothetical protein
MIIPSAFCRTLDLPPIVISPLPINDLGKNVKVEWSRKILKNTTTDLNSYQFQNQSLLLLVITAISYNLICPGHPFHKFAPNTPFQSEITI